MRRKLRLLVELIEPKTRKVVITDFEDEIGVGQAVALPQVGAGVDKAQFRMKVRSFVERHRDTIALQKVRRGQQLTAQNLTELERMFLSEGVDPAALSEAVGADGLGVFLRSMIGLDRGAAKEMFSEFTATHSLNADHTEFLNLIIDSLSESGIVDPERIYESPFTDLDDMGIAGVFKEAQIKELITIVTRSNSAASAVA